ncbi:MAG: DUF6491 family protein [Tahibacter sp.]
MKWSAVFACLLPMAVLLPFGAIASAEREKEQLATYERLAGPEVKEMPFWRMESFETLDDDAVLVLTSLNDAWLIKVLPPCTGLRFANSIGLTSNLHRVSQKFDHVVAGRDRCDIRSIQRVDYKAYRAERKQQRAEEKGAPGK